MNCLREYILKRQAELELSQNEVAERANKSSSWLSKFMSGDRKNIRVDTLIDLSKALEVTESHLIAAYKGENPDNIEDFAEELKRLTLQYLSLIPKRLIVEAILQEDGEEKMRELLAEAKRRYAEKHKKDAPPDSQP